MRSRRHLSTLVIAFVAAAAGSCAAQERASDDLRTGAEGADDGAGAVPWTPDVPDVPDEAWSLPDWAAGDPQFPWLPGEDRTRSRSIGGVTHGWLVNAVRIPRPHPALAVLPVQAERDFDYTTQEMLELVTTGANHVAEEYPGSILYLGNFSADGGGDIPQSVSHNSGRDADLAFYFVDEEGEQIEPPGLLPVPDDGTFVAPDGTKYVFDVERNWKLIEGIVEAGEGQIQYIFISNALRRMLLEHAREVDAARDTVRRAAVVLDQPGGALPHNDHFHVRIYCSEDDVRSGCDDRGRKIDGYDAHRDAHRDAVSLAVDHLEAEEAGVRVAAVRRLGLLEARGRSDDVAAMLDDGDAGVRAAAVRVLARFDREEKSVRARLDDEKDARVRAEIVWALGDFGSDAATEKLTALLDKPEPVEPVDGHTVDLRVLVADVLADAEATDPVAPLIALTSSEDATVRWRAHRALTMLTNNDPRTDGTGLHEAWQKWWKANRRKSRDAWLLAGFQQSGYDIDALALRDVWEITRPVLDADHLSYNAQRVLMRLSRRNPPSLDWPKSDANFYWRRWFERRCKRLGCPDVPDGLSTLD